MKHYHLVGIGGIGMGTLASLLLAQGHKMSGSDLKENALIRQLRAKGAKVAIGHQGSHVQNPDYVIYSSAVKPDNPELIEAVSRNVPVLKRAQVLAGLVNSQTGITIAGSHGKTTTASMVSCVLLKAGLEPTTAIGGIIKGDAYNANLGQGRYFVAEVDESDGTFLYFQPRYSIITNIDFEHVDYYKTWEGIEGAYEKFIQCASPTGCVIVCGEDQRLNQLVGRTTRKVVRYGFSSTHDVHAREVTSQGFQSRFECYTKQGKVGTFELSVPGHHNVLNALACISLGLELGISYEVMAAALKSFTGVLRRFQLKGQVDDIMVVDDYGHHPTEITATLKAARLFGAKRMVTVFQPHRYSRTKFLLNEFVDSLGLTDHLVLTDIYAASEEISDGVPVKTLLTLLEMRMPGKVIFLKKEHILAYVRNFVQPGDLVLFLGAGDIYQLSDILVRSLQQRHAGV